MAASGGFEGKLRHVWESRVLCPLHDPCGLGTDWWLSSESATHLTLFRRRDNNTEQALVEGLRRGGGEDEDEAWEPKTKTKTLPCPSSRVEHETNQTPHESCSPSVLSLHTLAQALEWCGAHTHQKDSRDISSCYSELSQVGSEASQAPRHAKAV